MYLQSGMLLPENIPLNNFNKYKINSLQFSKNETQNKSAVSEPR